MSARTTDSARDIPEATVARLPVYLRALTTLAENGTATCSSEELAAAAGVNSAKLRKDLSYLGSYGTRGVGYDVDYLRYQIAREIGVTQDWPVVIVGIGNLGHALANFSGFRSRGFRVVALLDADPERRGESVAGIDVRAFDDLDGIVSEHGVAIGVIATPASAAQDVADRMVAAGISSILNFAPTVIAVPDGVGVRKVDLSIELQILAYHEQRKQTEASRMSVLVVGVSHNSAPVSLLERVAPEAEAVPKLVQAVAACEHVTEATVIATCNRVEIYADVDRFHGSVEELSRLLVERSGASTEAMLPHLYVHYDDGAVSHLFQVASGLDSMAVGEGQILGQTRAALRLGQELGTVGPGLNGLFQQALRVGKRSRVETDIDRAAPTLVGAALDRAARHGGDVNGARVAVVGAGSMAGLATATVSRRGAAEIVVVNRTPERAERLAAEYGARWTPLSELPAVLAEADVVITCAGAAGLLVSRGMVEAVRTDGRPVVFVDLALPHDVDPAVAELPGVTRLDLEDLAEELESSDAGREVAEVRRIVTEEVSAFLAARRSASVTPTLVALRTMATSVVDAEMDRLEHRLPALTPAERAEVLQTVRRVADKLLHQPTVRVKELANETGAVSYAAALAELFALDPDAVDAVTRPEGLA